jgi:hypothetical protein
MRSPIFSRFICVGLIFISNLQLVHAKIIKSSSLQSVLKDAQVDRDTLVVFDMDKTIVQKYSVPADIQTWLAAAVKDLTARGVPADQAQIMADTFAESHKNKVVFTPMEEVTVSEIHDLQAAGFHVLVLTAQFKDVSDITLFSLRTLGLEFLNSSRRFQENPFGQESDILFKNGVIFAGYQNDKGEVLKQLLHVNQFTPSKLIFIDDEIKNIRNMEKAFSNGPIPNFNFHYSFPFRCQALFLGASRQETGPGTLI